MSKKTVHVLLFEEYADWEIGYILPEVKRLGGLEVTTVGFTTDSVTSMGSLQVTPDISLKDVMIEDVLLFIIPGGMLWSKSYPEVEIQQFIQMLASRKTPIAAICDATIVLAKAGVLHGTTHSSNSIAHLYEKFPEYADIDTYSESLVSRDNHIITASGLGAVEFTLEILTELDIETSEMRAIWYDAFKHGIYRF